MGYFSLDYTMLLLNANRREIDAHMDTSLHSLLLAHAYVFCFLPELKKYITA